jgi:hypothetical protein
LQLMLTFEFSCAVDRAIMLRSKSMPHVDVKARIGSFYALKQYTKFKKVFCCHCCIRNCVSKLTAIFSDPQKVKLLKRDSNISQDDSSSAFKDSGVEGVFSRF